MQIMDQQKAVDYLAGYLGEDNRDQAERMIALAWYCTVRGTTGNIPVVTTPPSGGEVSVIYDGKWYRITRLSPRR